MERSNSRLWMTGAAAVLTAAALAAFGDGEAGGDEDRSVVRRVSRHGMAETARRIEQAAADRGLPVFARFDAGALAPTAWPPAGGRRLIVLRAGADGTPVLLAEDASSRPEALLGVALRALRGNATEVSFHRLPRSADGLLLLPGEVAEAMSRLPGMVALALGD